jgi:serine/threonine protein kinase
MLARVTRSSGQPEVFGKYHLLERIAVGGMAEVYRARAYGTAGFEKILVIKKVLDHLIADEEFKRLFIDEAKIAESLHHVNIVQVWALGEIDGHYFMEMEYVHGLDLSRLVSRARNLGPFPVELALFIAAEVLKALQFAHSRTDATGAPMRIVHCDISPQNILISYSGEVKITDFGISRAAFQSRTQHEVIRGKYAYMSPEQVDGKPIDGRSDLFSLGIVLYEALTGHRLFKARSRDETLSRVRRADVPPPRLYRSDDISEELEAFLLKALARRPEARFKDASEMFDALATIVVREGHRATNNDVAAYLKQVIESATTRKSDSAPAASLKAIPPTAVVVLAAEAATPPRSIAAPRASLVSLGEEWAEIVADAGGEIWESDEGSALVVWIAKGGLKDTVERAVRTAKALQRCTTDAAYKLSAGVATGIVRLRSDSNRPPDGWELQGPFYLARWMMNLSAHRGRVLVTEVAHKKMAGSTHRIGRVAIQGNRYVNLYELG